ncbi:MAG: hypothetical protein GY865_17020 [candidate division Zixibacteria bacterium]|nr:hypothetical protein [candidate division Zixibacteria bacterium]
MTEEEVLKSLKESLVLPKGYDICVKAMADVLGTRHNDKEWIKNNFSDLVENVQIKAYQLYLDAERPAVISAFRNVLGNELPDMASNDDFFELLENNFWALDRFFLGLTQGRRPRAGKAFEHVIKVLFNKLGYPYTPQAIINGQPDFLLPSIDHYRTNAMDCIIFTVKRTLRERWRQITTEGTQGFLFFLATIDKDVGPRDLTEMKKNRIYLVLPNSIKKKHYSKIQNAISFEKFFSQHLDPAMARWRANGVIE